MFLFILVFALLGCSGSEKLEKLDETVKLEGTVIGGESDSSFLFVEEFVEVNQGLTVEEAYEKYDSALLYSFSFEKDKLAEFKIGDKVIVWAPDEFYDTEPQGGTAEKVEIVE
ncbi:hypothetical protein J2R98_000745 [Alkalibacillus filiformis]|uniref:DUF3221 domain-containing protein n=1 Tax=Alkalibacillus filiformis TaxID=200990 RepID=A0ABU0DR67_9BACI|nr:hypothetical protein [Alkalibacillus filiformis]